MPSPLAALAHQAEKIGRRKLGLAAVLAQRVQRGAQKIHGGDAGDFERILEGEKDALGRALVGLQRQEILAFKEHATLRDLVAFAAGEHIGERGLARAVRAHDGVHLARVHGKIEAVEDLPLADPDVEVLDFKQGAHSPSQ